MAGNKVEYGEIEIKKDCQMHKEIGNSREGTCSGLNQLYCKHEKCNFYKPRKQKV